MDGSAQLASNLHPGSKSLTHGRKSVSAATNSHVHDYAAENEELRQQVQHAKDEATVAKNEIVAAKAGLDLANTKYA